MTDMVNLYAAKTNLSKLVERRGDCHRQSGQAEGQAGALSAAPKKAPVWPEPPRDHLHCRGFRRASATGAAKVLRVGPCGC